MTEATVVGMSQGGFIPLRMALAAPDRVRGFALIDTGVEDGLLESRGFIQIAGGGHAPNLAHPELLNPHLVDFVRDVYRAELAVRSWA